MYSNVYSTADNGRFLNYYGHAHARLYRSQLVEPQEKPTLFIQFLFLVLFGSPTMHLETLSEFYIDGLIYTEGWRKLIDLLLKDWQDLILWVRSAPLAYLNETH